MESLTLRMPERTITTAQAEEDTLPLAELFADMEGPLLAYGYQLMNDRDQAQDLLQEAFLRLHRCFDEVRRPQAWLYRTVRNLAFNHKRKHGKIVPFNPADGKEGPLPETVDEEPLPDARAERMEAAGMLKLCVERLAEDVRALVKMKFVEGLSYKEMSTRTGLSVGYVGYKLHHAIKDLADEMEKEGLPI